MRTQKKSSKKTKTGRRFLPKAEVGMATTSSGLFTAVDQRHIKAEREKAKELKKTKWWQSRLGEGRCYYCEKKFSPEALGMEHLVPLARGGFSIKNNVVPACSKCNFAKKHQTILEIRLKK